MEFDHREKVLSTHPSLAGHFPGNPLVPGVIILDRVIQAVQERQPGSRIVEVISAKFTAPLRPGQPFTISIKNRGGIFHFDCSNGDISFASGRLSSNEEC